MTLTAKQEAFAQAVAGGMNQSDAYRAVYEIKTMKPETVHQVASRAVKSRKVSARLAELKAATASKALWTRERSVQALAAIADGSKAKANEIVAAIKELNLMHGFNAPTKLELGGTLIHRVELVAMNDSRPG